MNLENPKIIKNITEPKGELMSYSDVKKVVVVESKNEISEKEFAPQMRLSDPVTPFKKVIESSKPLAKDNIGTPDYQNYQESYRELQHISSTYREPTASTVDPRATTTEVAKRTVFTSPERVINTVSNMRESPNLPNKNDYYHDALTMRQEIVDLERRVKEAIENTERSIQFTEKNPEIFKY